MYYNIPESSAQQKNMERSVSYTHLCLGAITRDRLEAVRESDAILREEFQLAGLDKKVWQYFTVCLLYTSDFVVIPRNHLNKSISQSDTSFSIEDRSTSITQEVRRNNCIFSAVSYTHLDVYKRQTIQTVTVPLLLPSPETVLNSVLQAHLPTVPHQ